MPEPRSTVLHLVHRLTFGGAERVLVNYLNGSFMHRHIVCSLLPADSFAEEITNEKVQVVSLNKKNGNDGSIPFQLARLCNKFSVDVVHCQGWGTYLEGLLCAKILRRRTGFVFAFHGKTLDDLGKVPVRRVLAQKIGAFLGDAVITPSREMRADYARSIGIREERVKVIYNGVDTELFQPVAGPVSARNEFGLETDTMVFGCVARLDPVKNFPGLLQAFATACAQGLQAHLLIIGDGPQMEELTILARELGVRDKVIFAGRRTDVAGCLHAMDCYVQASFYEGFSMTILEAMSSGLPVLAFDVGGTREMVRHKENGLLLPSRDTGALCRAMCEMAADREKCRRYGRQARKIIENNFSLQDMRARYDRLFADCSRRRN